MLQIGKAIVIEYKNNNHYQATTLKPSETNLKKVVEKR